MSPEERQDLSLFGAAERHRTAQQVGCTVGQVRKISASLPLCITSSAVNTGTLSHEFGNEVQVNDCIAKYEWMKHMTAKMAQLKKEGKPLPTSIEEVEQKLGESANSCFWNSRRPA